MRRRRTIYEVCFKRLFDIIFSFFAIILLSPILIILAIVVRIKHGKPVFFRQERPGKNGKPFKMYKFRSMTNEKDENGNLLPDEKRLTNFGKKLRSTSLDELPGLFNILKGNMSIVGPRPFDMRDAKFLTKKENKRHLVRPGLTGLAQVNGRNGITWDEKFKYDFEYIKKITLWKDIKIILKTVLIVLKREGINHEGEETNIPLGEYRMKIKSIKRERK